MSSMPPEPGFGFPENTGLPPEQLANEHGPRPRRMSGMRITCGIIWAVITVILAAGFVAELSIHIIGGAVLCLVLAVGTGWYDSRVWTLKARRLLMII